MKEINWYPGHMKKTRELIQENLKQIDVVLEIIDARIPVSSRNPIIDTLIQNKKRIMILNKSDLGDPGCNNAWVKYFKQKNMATLMMNANKGEGLPQLFRELEKVRSEMNLNAKRIKPLRIMIVGIPNVGKSSLINRLANRKGTQIGNKPGVTKGKQWLNIGNNVLLLDTPGILWPKFEDPSTGEKLAFIGSIRDQILDIEELVLELVDILMTEYQEQLYARYKITEDCETPQDVVDAVCRNRGFFLSGERLDNLRGSRTIIEEFRAGKIGRITLERP